MIGPRCQNWRPTRCNRASNLSTWSDQPNFQSDRSDNCSVRVGRSPYVSVPKGVSEIMDHHVHVSLGPLHSLRAASCEGGSAHMYLAYGILKPFLGGSFNR